MSDIQNDDNPIDFSGQVAIVTGAGRGLGRLYAMDLARRGAKVVVNDLGKNEDGNSSAEVVAKEIEAEGGIAMANTDSVADLDAMTTLANSLVDKWGRIDIYVANAGILRDKTFAKMDFEDFKASIDINLVGAACALKAIWPIMMEQKYGRVVFATSGAGLYGNFGQTNYSAAKLGMVGMMKTLRLEGMKYGIRLNGIAPSALTPMTIDITPPERRDAMSADFVVPGVTFLCSKDAPEDGVVLCAGSGVFNISRVVDTVGVDGMKGCSAEDVRTRWADIIDPTGQRAINSGQEWHEYNGERMMK